MPKKLPQNFTPMPPNEWKEKHMIVLARKFIYDNSIICLFQANCTTGLPMKKEDAIDPEQAPGNWQLEPRDA